MKKIKNFVQYSKVSEYLNSETYFRAIERLKGKGHINRADTLSKWAVDEERLKKNFEKELNKFGNPDAKVELMLTNAKDKMLNCMGEYFLYTYINFDEEEAEGAVMISFYIFPSNK
jgi:hypothetical protein